VAGAAGSQGARQLWSSGAVADPARWRKSSGGGGALEPKSSGGGGLEATTGGGEARERRLREAAVPEREASREIWGKVRSRVTDPYGHGCGAWRISGESSPAHLRSSNRASQPGRAESPFRCEVGSAQVGKPG
jgi:hypothetical protein